MGVRLFDANCRIGRRLAPGPDEPSTAEELLAELDRLEIEKALVMHYSCIESLPALGNERLEKEAGPHPRLVRAWTAVADTAGDVPPAKEWVDAMLRAGARAAWIFPKRMNWRLDEWCAGSLLAALEERGVPTFMAWEEADAGAIHQALEHHPRLPFVVTNVGYRENRVLIPLLEAHPNLRMDLSPRFDVHEGVERLTQRVGAARLLFGSGYPVHEPGAALAMLAYARIAEEERELIGARNLEALVAEVAA